MAEARRTAEEDLYSAADGRCRRKHFSRELAPSIGEEIAIQA
jgi:hypothetical protein